MQPRRGIATHLSYNREFVPEMLAGIPVVVKLSRDRIWIRDAALPQSADIARPDAEWLAQNNFGGQIPAEVCVDNPVVTRDLGIDLAEFTPPDQMRADHSTRAK